MTTMRGEAVLPESTPTRPAARMTVEVRDVALEHVPAGVVTRTVLENVPLAPNRIIEFDLDLPETPADRRLALHVHVDVEGTGTVSAGDLVTVEHVPVTADHELVATLSRI